MGFDDDFFYIRRSIYMLQEEIYSSFFHQRVGTVMNFKTNTTNTRHIAVGIKPWEIK